jgi:hypothetical protein
MKRLTVIALLGFTFVFAFGSAHAGPSTRGFGAGLRVVGGSLIIPAEWDGIWTTADSTYDCTAGFTAYSVDEDTICGGQTYSEAPPDTSVELTCTGTANATTMHATCNGSSMFFPDCQANYEIVVDVVRTGETYRSVTTINITFSGTGVGCSFIPTRCTRIVTYGTRTASAPPSFCTTSVKRSTWGELKAHYR